MALALPNDTWFYLAVQGVTSVLIYSRSLGKMKRRIEMKTRKDSLGLRNVQKD